MKYKSIYPLDTFTGETRKELEVMIDYYCKLEREETIREVEKKIIKYIDKNKKKNFNNRELIGYEILDLIN